jgi:AraC-like DNA-binding protein
MRLSAERESFGVEEFRSFGRPFFDMIPTGSSKTFRACANSAKLGPLIVSDVRFDDAIFDRDPRRLREFDTEFLMLETYDEGTNHGRSGDTVTGLETNATHVIDMANPWRTQSTGVSCRSRSVVLPYSAMGYDPSRHPAYARLDADSPRNAMLRAGMAALFDAGEYLDSEESEALAESFCALVWRLLFDQRGCAPEEHRDKDHGLFLRRFIDDHLAEPDLGPQRLCDALGISRATLYRVFPENGGVSGYITARRMDRCFDELRQSGTRRGGVRAVSERWGFFDAKSFNRAFRRRFGIAPSDCRGSSAGIEADTAVAHAMNDWMRRL